MTMTPLEYFIRGISMSDNRVEQCQKSKFFDCNYTIIDSDFVERRRYSLVKRWTGTFQSTY